MSKFATPSQNGLGPYLRKIAWCLAALSIALLAGCRGTETDRGEFTRVYTPQVPVFLSGPTAALLTNTPGFSAHLTLRSDSAFPQSETVEGEVLARGTKLLFAPKESGSKDKALRTGGFSFIWDAATASGFVLSDALQAYAPVASTLHVTNVLLAPGGAAPRQATAFLNDGTRATFRVWPAHDPTEPPERIEADGSPPLALAFSRVRPLPPAPDLFAPPDGFSKYPNPAALADEIAARQYNLRRGTRVPGSTYNIPVQVR